MFKWWELTEQQRNELIATHVLKWELKNNQWFKRNTDGELEGPQLLLPFTTDEDSAWQILKTFDNWQVTKMFPLTYRVIISTSKNRGLSKSLPEAICLAALHFNGINYLEGNI
jgi:hypothetical protein